MKGNVHSSAYSKAGPTNNSLNILVGNAANIGNSKFQNHQEMLSLDPNNRGNSAYMPIQPQSTKASVNTGAPLQVSVPTQNQQNRKNFQSLNSGHVR